MAINRDPAEWFERLDREEVYGIVKGTDTWLVLKKNHTFGFAKTTVEVMAEVDSRAAAIGYIKLLSQET